MRCERCVLESPEGAALPVEAFAEQLASCTECPLLQGGGAPAWVELLVRKHREAARAMRRLHSKVRQREVEVDEQRAEIERADERLARLQSLHDASRRELEAQIELQRQQQAAMRAMATPLLRVWHRVLALPVIGKLDRERAENMMADLLVEIASRGATHAIVDLTGVDEIDETTADHLLRISAAAKLLGARVLLTGIRGGVARALVDVDADLTAVTTLNDVEEALRQCAADLRQRRGPQR